MVAVGKMDSIEGGGAPMRDILRDLQIVEKVVLIKAEKVSRHPKAVK
jgi:hypothetical protein